jgi:ferredoxin
VRIVVDNELCEGNAECMKIAPDVFVVGDDDRARLLVERPGEALRAKVEAAVRRCPRQALSIVED